MLALILGFITGLAGPLSSAWNKLADLKIAKVQADNDIQRAKINEQIEEVHDKRSVLIAEAGSRVATMMNVSIRTWIGAAVAAILTKLLVWDKIVGSFYGCAGGMDKFKGGIKPACITFTTDALDPYIWGTIAVATGFYFVSTWSKK